ncbi:MAG: hypothetical protein RR956_06500 [Christensenella sp.]
MAVDWNKIYEDKFNESANGYEEQKKRYDTAMQSEQSSLQQERDSAKKTAKENMDNAARGAFVTRELGRKNMSQRMAAQGLGGGMTETTNSALLRDFGNATNAANSAYSKAVTDIDGNYMKSNSAVKSSWAQKMDGLDQSRRAQALEQAKLAYRIAVEEEARRKAAEEEARLAAEEEARLAAEAAARAGRRGRIPKPTNPPPDIRRTAFGSYDANDKRISDRERAYQATGGIYGW